MYTKLFASIREYKRPSLEAPVYVSLEVVMECLIPFIVARLVNQVRAGCSLGELFRDGGILVVMAFMSLWFGILAGNACSTASCGFARNLRSDMFRAVQKFSFANIDKFSAASLITRITTDVANVQQAYMMLVRTVIRGPLMVVFACVMAFVMGGRTAWVYLGVVPFLALGLFGIARYAMPVFRRLFVKYDRLNESIQENVQGVRVVKAFVREDFEKEKFARAAGELCGDFTRAERVLAFNNPIMQLSMYTVTLFILYYGTYRVVVSRGLDLNVGQISALMTYGVQILGSLMRMSMVFVMVTLARESAVRIVEVLEEVPEITSPADGLSEVADGSIEFEHVSFSYGEGTFALHNVNIRIASGETVGIIGGTGSSKTTLVQLIPRLYDASQGVVRVGGHDVRNYDIEALRNNVAVVLQKNELFSGTIRENLLWGNKNATDAEIREVCRIACADEFIDRLPQKLDTWTEQNGTNLSGGQKQRLCLARALLKKPKVLILDDSTSAVDTHTDAKIRSGLREYMPGATKIIIAQRILSVQDADRIIVMDKGEVDAVGTHEELLKSCEIYGEIYASQNREF
ncbi:MAG: ABC transporter ATP-binding protein [Synergistaceae bacterium]|nr:ABC transporter ATP-binding protein [Synergistaceae bacterium]